MTPSIGTSLESPAGRRLIVFDDDPTGTQLVSDVDIILDGTAASIADAFATSDGPLYVLTNSRSMARADAVARIRELKGHVETAARARGERCAIVLRGDSTLRGHVFAEVDAIADSMAPVLFVPAFPEGGRVTINGEQRVRVDDSDQNVADTEFARDVTFGFRSRDLVAWTAEVGDGRSARMIPLDAVRETSGTAVTDCLLGARPGDVIIPEVCDSTDIDLVLGGTQAAEAAGVMPVIRAAASFTAAYAGLRSRSIGALDLGPQARVLVAAGSHTDASSLQLAALAEAGLPTCFVALDRSPEPIIEALRASLLRGRASIVATPREFVAGTDVVSGAVFLDALVAVVDAVASGVDAIVAKGGITAARIARSLGARTARVEGQLSAGIALWTLDLLGRRLPYVVVPGNVGDRGTLVATLAQLGALPRTPSTEERAG